MKLYLEPQTTSWQLEAIESVLLDGSENPIGSGDAQDDPFSQSPVRRLYM